MNEALEEEMNSANVAYNLDDEMNVGSQNSNSRSDSILEREQINNELIDQICEQISEFQNLKAGWDGPDSKRPLKFSIDEAMNFLSYWKIESRVPEPELTLEGAVALEFYDDERNSCGSVEFRDNSLGVFAIIDLYDVIDKGTFRSNSKKDIVGAVARIQKALMNVSRIR